MSIAEKLTTIAENQQQVYNAGKTKGYNEGQTDGYGAGYDFGYLEGQLSGGGVTVPPDKIIEATETGSFIAVNGVSEVPHKCTISVDKDTVVQINGKNLLKLNGREPLTAYSFTGPTSKFNLSGNKILIGYAYSGYLYSPYVKDYSITENTVSFICGQGAYGIGIDVKILPDTQYTLTAETGENVSCRVSYYDIEGMYISFTSQSKFTTPSNAAYAVIVIMANNGGATEALTATNLQLECGTMATTYEPFTNIGTYEVAAGQFIEFASMCPSIVAHSNNDAVMTLNYRKSWGMQAEYDRFWDCYQDSGARTNYFGAFMGNGWNNITGLPKYGVQPKEAYMMFGYGSYNMDLDDIFTNRGLVLDFSKCTNFNYCFQSSNITAIGTIDMSSATSTDAVFAGPHLKTIRNLIPPARAFAAAAFNAALENLTIGGAITKNMNLSRCSKLTAASVQSVLDHLEDLTGLTSQTITFHATVGATLTDEQKAAITAKNWTLAY